MGSGIELCQFMRIFQFKYPTENDKGTGKATNLQPGPEVIKLFACSTQLSMKF